jgi:hypothetical protein
MLYLAALALASAAVFFATYFFGRNSSLEAELERLAAPRTAPDPGKSKGIPSLQRIETPPEAPASPPVPGGEPLGEGVVVSRSPLEPPGMVIVADLPALASSPGGGAQSSGGGLAAFLSRPPAGLQVGMRALAGAESECGATDSLSGLGSSGGGGDLARALDAASGLGRGPRNPAKAVEAAAEELKAVPGERLIVIIAGGEEECRADLCGSAPPPGGSTQRIHVLLIAAPPQPGAEPGMPEAGFGVPPPVFEPDWAAPYRCLAERSGGTVAAVSSPEATEAALRRIAGDLEAALVVKAFHFTGQEVVGISPGGETGWGARVRRGGDVDAGTQTRESEIYPAAFSVPGGVYVVKSRYGGQERTAAVAVAPGERAEVRVAFATGELFLQALDAAGGEIVGDSAGFRCAWGADVFPGEGDDARPVASTCSFPARLELSPGSYRVRARWKGIERVVDEVTVEAGASAVRAVTFGEDEQ